MQMRMNGIQSKNMKTKAGARDCDSLALIMRPILCGNAYYYMAKGCQTLGQGGQVEGNSDERVDSSHLCLSPPYQLPKLLDTSLTMAAAARGAPPSLSRPVGLGASSPRACASSLTVAARVVD
eukprot:1942466-Pleurochrysis_carterae.AAC.1